jgi:hypothetical protein
MPKDYLEAHTDMDKFLSLAADGQTAFLPAYALECGGVLGKLISGGMDKVLMDQIKDSMSTRIEDRIADPRLYSLVEKADTAPQP